MRSSSISGFDLPSELRAAAEGLRDTLEGSFEGWRAGARGGTGSRDIRSAVLVELAEKPMHGYQLIQATQERTHGSWTPTPGAVYPTLQLLVDEGLATAAQDGEHKVYTLTETGRTAAAALSADEPSDSGSRGRSWDDRAALPKAGARLARAASSFGGASDEQTERAVAVLDEARRKLYAILAEE